MSIQSTYFGLMAEFGSGEVKLADCCEKYFGMNEKTAKQRAAAQELPVRTFVKDGEIVVSAQDLADQIDQQKIESRERFESAQSMRPKKLNVRYVAEPRLPYDDVPVALRGIGELRQIPKHEPPPGVYFLCKGDEVVYVGQSVLPATRIARHVFDNTREFDRVFLLPVKPERLNEVEAAFITQMQPALQGQKGGECATPIKITNAEEIIRAYYAGTEVAE